MVLTNIDLDWSFGPQNYWLWLTTGIDLLELKRNNKFCQFLLLLLNIVVQIFIIRQLSYDVAFVNQFFDQSTTRQTMTRNLNLSIDYINWTSTSLMTHLSLLLVVRNYWPNLMRLYRLSVALFDRQFYFKLRRLSILGVAYVIISYGGLVLMLIAYRWHNTGFSQLEWTKTLVLNCLQVLLQMHLTNSWVLFCICGQVLSFVFKSIREEIVPEADVFTLRMALHRYHIACETVEAINNCFGWTFLAVIPFCMIGLVNVSFFLFEKHLSIYSEVDSIFAILPMYVINITAICWTADDIRQKADELLPEIRRLPFDLDGDSQNELMRGFLTQIGQAPALISASGLFYISSRLIPQLIGTTLTYFFILYQFQESELLAIATNNTEMHRL